MRSQIALLLTFFAGCVVFPLERKDRAGTVLWTRDKPAVAIVLAANPTAAEQTAAQELADYLEKSSGMKFTITTEDDTSRLGPGIYVGHTARALAAGLDPASWGQEQWAMRTTDGDLLLTGGRPRGTLYAVYHFLEDVVGIRWWNPFEESVPHRAALEIGALARRGQPRFAYRDINHLYANDAGRFAARNRINGDGFGPIIDPAFGSGIEFGPPYGVHTFYLYIPPEKYFAEHPEWFSMRGGKRTAERAQLCLTNPALRVEVVRRLREFIEQSRATASKAGRPAPVDFDISQNDWGGMCECPDCRALTKREGSHSGPLIDFLNKIAESISADYPNLMINTLAYRSTEDPPRSLRPHRRLVPRLCDTNADILKPITHVANRAFAERLARWGQLTTNLRVWDYAVTYSAYPGLPLPTTQTYAPDYRYFAEHGVEGVFTEHEYPIQADMRDFKLWVMMKLLEDPYREYETLVHDFTEGFYGPAATHVATAGFR